MSALKRGSRRASISGELPPCSAATRTSAEEAPTGMQDNLLDLITASNENAPGAANGAAGVSASSGSANASGSSIAARLEALRRETSRMSGAVASSPLKAKPSAPMNSQSGIQFEAAGQLDSRGLAALAIELFDDKFKAACDKGLNATLQRTRDGATAESRIAELAGAWKTPGVPCVRLKAAAPMWQQQQQRPHSQLRVLPAPSIQVMDPCNSSTTCAYVRVCSSGEDPAAIADPDERQEGPVRVAEPQVRAGSFPAGALRRQALPFQDAVDQGASTCRSHAQHQYNISNSIVQVCVAICMRVARRRWRR